MADSYRYRCGECGHRTAWGTQSRGGEGIEIHYARRHPNVALGGLTEFREGPSRSGTGCLIVLGILVLLLILASQH